VERDYDAGSLARNDENMALSPCYVAQCSPDFVLVGTFQTVSEGKFSEVHLQDSG